MNECIHAYPPSKDDISFHILYEIRTQHRKILHRSEELPTNRPELASSQSESEGKAYISLHYKREKVVRVTVVDSTELAEDIL